MPSSFRWRRARCSRIVLHGLAADTQFEFGGRGAARAHRQRLRQLPAFGRRGEAGVERGPAGSGGQAVLRGGDALANQPWPRPDAAGGVARFQGDAGRTQAVALLLRGTGEVTRVQGDPVLAWNVEPVPGSAERRLVVQFNQPQKDHLRSRSRCKRPWGHFHKPPRRCNCGPRGRPALPAMPHRQRRGGASGSGPGQRAFPDLARAISRRPTSRGRFCGRRGNQRFVYRFSGADFGLRIQADQILPELAVSEVLAYHLGENELAIDAEIELDIREAPLRELLLRVPKGYAIAQLVPPGLSDYFLREPADQPEAELRLVYGQPISGRQVVQLRLERNKALEGSPWALAAYRGRQGQIGARPYRAWRRTRVFG